MKNKVTIIIILIILAFFTISMMSFEIEEVPIDTYPSYESVYIDNEVLIKTIKKELKKDDNNFISLNIYSSEKINDTEFYVYTWIYDATYELKNKIILETINSSSNPVRFKIYINNNDIKIIEKNIPRDGGLLEKDMKEYFPNNVIVEMKNTNTSKLVNDNLNEAKKYYKLK